MSEFFKIKSFLKKLVSQDRLRLVEPSLEIRESYIKKSQSNLDSARILLDNIKLEEAIALTYYSMYNSLNALLFSVGIKSENHTASIFLLDYLFEFDNSGIKSAKDERVDKQYYTNFKIILDEVIVALEEAEKFNYELLNIILKLNKESIDFYRQKFKELLSF